MFRLFDRRKSVKIDSFWKGAHALAGIAFVAGLFLLNPAGIISSSGNQYNQGGVIDGEFSHSPHGAVTFNVPIKVAPGIQGLQPTLSLSYNSQNQNQGPTGVGWSLAGLSSISRCGQTLLVDGQRTGVSYTTADRLCIDGARLVARNAYADDAGYWSGNTYSKEIEDWSEVVPTGGTCTGGPCGFEAHLPDGRVMVYGGSADSQRKTARNRSGEIRPIKEWLLKKIRDRNGNEIVYNYRYPRYWNAVHILSIEYNGRSVHFDWEGLQSGPKRTGSFDGTGPTSMNYRIRTIRVSTATSEYKRYDLTYGASVTTGRSRLEQIDECDAASNCLDPLVIGWNDQATMDGKFRVVTPAGPNYQSKLRYDWGANIIPGDFNGDGKTDLIRQERGFWDDDNSGTFSVYFSNGGDGTFTVKIPDGPNAQIDYQNTTPARGAKLLTGDFNGDGMTDFIRIVKGSWSTGNNTTTAFRIYFANGDIGPGSNGFDMYMPQDRPGAELQTWVRDHKGNFITGDFNGDGKTDFIRQTKGDYDNDLTHNFKVFFATGNPLDPFTVVTPEGHEYQNWLRYDWGANILPGDFNGDGKTDFIRQERAGWATNSHPNLDFAVYFSRGDGTFDTVFPTGADEDKYQLVTTEAASKLILGDYNGDGKTDFIRLQTTNTSNYVMDVYLSKGNGYFEIVPTGFNLLQTFGSHLIPLDYNGDGRTDFVRQRKARSSYETPRGTFQVYVSRGDGKFDKYENSADPQHGISLDGDMGAFIIPGDYDGDGRTDFIRQEHSGWDNDQVNSFGVYFASPVQNQAPLDSVASIQQGPVSHNFTYRRLTNYDPTAGVAASELAAFGPDSDQRYFRGGSLAVLDRYARSAVTHTEAVTEATQTIERTYEYHGGIMHAGGRGFQGFRRVVSFGIQEELKTIREYYIDYPFTSHARRITERPLNNPLSQISDSEFTMEAVAGASAKSVAVRNTEQRIDKNQDVGFMRNTANFQYDSVGNLALFTENDGRRLIETCSTYANDATNQRPGPLTGSMQGSGCTASANSCSCSNMLTEFQVTHDGNNNVIERKDYDSSNNAWITVGYGYDSHGNRNRVTLPNGAVETTAYENTYNTYPETVTTTDGAKTFTESRAFDPRHGTPGVEADANGAVREIDYDSFGRPVAIRRTGPGGVLVQTAAHSYATSGAFYLRNVQVRAAWDSATMTTEKEFTDGLGRLVRKQAGSGPDERQELTYLNARGAIAQKSLVHKPGESPGWSHYGYNDQHKLNEINHPGGARTSLVYRTGGAFCDSGDQRIETFTTVVGDSSAVPRSQFECKNFGGKTLKLVLQDAKTNNRTTTQTMTLDALDRLTGIADGQASTAIVRDSLGRAVQINSSDRGVTEFEYNAHGLLAVERNNSEEKHITYDGFGRKTRITFHDGSYAAMQYDDAALAGSQARVTAEFMVNENGVETSRREYAYDPDGNVTVTRLILDGGSGGTHVMDYKSDPIGRPDRVLYPSGRLVCYSYDGLGDLTQIKESTTGDCSDTTGEVYAAYSNYTSQGQPRSIVYGNGVATDFTYDDQNRVRTNRTTDSESAVLLNQRYTWTALNQVAAIEDLAGTNDTAYTYDGFGFLTSAVGPYGNLSYEYNSSGNMTKKADLNIAYAGSRPVSADNGLALTYDAHGNVTQRDSGDGNVYTLDYDARYKIRQVAKNGVLAGSYTYDARGDRVKKVDGNGNETFYVNRDLEITRFAGGRILRTEYIQSRGGRIAAISASEDPVAMIHGTSGTHAMEARMYSLSSVSGLAGFLNHTTMSYVRNPVIASVAIVVFWALLLAALLTAGIVYMLGRVGAYERRRRRLLWPAPVLVATFLSMSIQCGSNSGAKTFVVAPPGSDLFAFNFLLGPGGNGYGYPEEGAFYFQYDQVGSTSLVTDSAGKQAAHTVYKPYGEIYQDASEGRDIFRGKFNNNEYDRDAEMYFFNARYYDASIGSFLQADDLIVGTNGAHAAALNRYAFSGNNPVTYSDPGGKFFFLALIAIASAVGSAVSAAATVAVTAAVAVASAVASVAITAGSAIATAAIAAGSAVASAAAAAGAAIASAASAVGSAIATAASAAAGAGSAVASAAIAAAPSIASGALTGSAINGLMYGIETAITGEAWSWENFGIALGIGAAAGAIGAGVGFAATAGLKAVTTLTTRTVGRLSNAIGGFTEAFSRGAITQQVHYGTIDWGAVGMDAAVAGSLGGAFPKIRGRETTKAYQKGGDFLGIGYTVGAIVNSLDVLAGVSRRWMHNGITGY